MLIEITKNTVCNGRDVSIGEQIETGDRDAKFLIRRGKAMPIKPTIVEPVKAEVTPVKKQRGRKPKQISEEQNNVRNN